MTAIIETQKPARVLTFDKATANPLTHWNRKYGLDIWAFALPISTCDYSTKICRKSCYGKNIWKNIKPRYLINLKGSFKARFVRIVIDQIRRENIETIRIHVIGDFYNQEYFDKWCEIARNCPNVKILAYTRNYDIDASNAPKNFVIYYSIDDTTVKENPTIKLRAVLFRADRGKKLYQHMEKFNGREKTFVCSSRCEHCKACWAGKIDIAFPIRSGRYQYKLEHEPYLLDHGDWRTRVDKRGNPVLPPAGSNEKESIVKTAVSENRFSDDLKQCCETPDMIEVGNEQFCSNCGLVQGKIHINLGGMPTVDNVLKKVMVDEKQRMIREIDKAKPKLTRQSFKKQITKILSIMDNMKREFAELEMLIAQVDQPRSRKKKVETSPPNAPSPSLGHERVAVTQVIRVEDGIGLVTKREKKTKPIPKAMQYENGKFKCDWCDRRFFTEKGKQKHMVYYKRSHDHAQKIKQKCYVSTEYAPIPIPNKPGWYICCEREFNVHGLHMHKMRAHDKKGGPKKKITA